MRYFSTRDPAGKDGTTVDLKSALLSGMAPDGGLYLPERIPTVANEDIAMWREGTSFPEMASQLAHYWFEEDIESKVIQNIVQHAYTFQVPLKEIVAHQYCCELFHGPSLSFKDFAAQFLLRMLDYLLERDKETALVLTATSGDTGSAVAAAAHGRKRLKAVVLYPRGKISPLQEQQITCWGDNVNAVAVEGTFDDCQRLVKKAISDLGQGDEEVIKRFPFSHITSANSINVGRLLPQTFYYWWATTQLTSRKEEATVVVPSGNFGNLTAGVLAKRMGAPIARFVAATNVNDTVPRFLESGEYLPNQTQQTISNAMDVSSPSNFERLRYLYNDNLEDMRAEISAISVDDPATRTTMYWMADKNDYLLDPHTAVAWTALENVALMIKQEGLPLIALSTAHPAKFPNIVEKATDREVELPDALKQCLDLPQQSITLENATDEAFLDLLANLP